MKKYYSYSKLRKLKVLSRRIQFLLKNQNKEAAGQIRKLKTIIYRLINDLKFYFSKKELIKILGSAALIFGLSFSNQVSAQWFEAPQTNPFGLDSTDLVAVPEFADLDDDGDLDLLVSEYYGNLLYFENTGNASSPDFDDPVTNPFGISIESYFAFPAFVDLDNDGDLDLMIGEYYGDLEYFENTGSASSPVFGAAVTNPFELVAPNNFAALEFVDLDNDGDFDILLGDYTIESNGYYDYQAPFFQYYENIGTASAPEFTEPLINPFGLEDPDAIPFPTFADLDNDGDYDLIVGQSDYESYYSVYGNLNYFENIGSASVPDFDSPSENPFGLTATYYIATPDLADLDDDGDFDLMVGEYYGALKYFENSGVVGISDIDAAHNLSLFPNPVQDILKIKSDDLVEKIEVVDVLGKTVIYMENPPSSISFSDLKTGMYIVKISFSNGDQSLKKILKE